ncbi:HNH endonuclease [Nodosilinea sp. FACHB-13]|nr:HNH endonuclease [Nodosilinea sp. FACHB-13]
MTIVYRPNHRKEAMSNVDSESVFMGVSGKRHQQKLIFRRKSGQYASIHCSSLIYEIYPDGALTVVLQPFGYGYVRLDQDNNYIKLIADSLYKCIDKVEKIFSENGISYTFTHNFTYTNLADAILNSPEEDEYLSRYSLYIFSPTYYFPTSRHRGLWEVKRAFVALYPILDSFITIAKGQTYPLEMMLDKLIDYQFTKGWYFSRRKEWTDEDKPFKKAQDEINLPELESYQFIRAGLWWEILARDKWTCCSCGRSAKEHGTTLHVDHIVPRSKGGTDNKENLQALCWKCNIGKSNKDMTDLRDK